MTQIDIAHFLMLHRSPAVPGIRLGMLHHSSLAVQAQVAIQQSTRHVSTFVALRKNQ